MNRFLLVSALSFSLVMSATCLRAEDAAKPAADAASTNKVAKVQTLCPVMSGNPINKDLFVDAEGKRIYVCCKGCIGTIKKNPAKYIKQMEADGIVLETAPAKAPAKAE